MPFWLPLLAASSAAGGLAVQRVRERRRIRRRLREVPEASAQVSESTDVRITGVVRALDETLTSPLSARTCVLYRVRAVSGGLNFARKRMPSRYGESFARRRFAIERDAGGAVEIDGDHVELDLPPTPRRSHSADRRESMRLVLGLSRAKPARFEELVLEPGARVVVTGFAMLDLAAAPPSGDVELGFRDGAPPRLRLTGSRARPLTISRSG